MFSANMLNIRVDKINLSTETKRFVMVDMNPSSPNI